MTCDRSSRAVLAHALVTVLVPVALFAQRPGSTISTEKLFSALGLSEGLTVCEIGAGDGELSIAAARQVGPRGHVYTSELGEERVRSLKQKVSASGLEQITVIAGDPAQTNFPDGHCDAVFMRNVYHHFDDPIAMDRSIAAALKPGGRAAVVDFTPRGAEASSPANRDRDGTHGVSADSVKREMDAAGLPIVMSESGHDRWFIVVALKSKG